MDRGRGWATSVSPWHHPHNSLLPLLPAHLLLVFRVAGGIPLGSGSHSISPPAPAAAQQLVHIMLQDGLDQSSTTAAWLPRISTQPASQPRHCSAALHAKPASPGATSRWCGSALCALGVVCPAWAPAALLLIRLAVAAPPPRLLSSRRVCRRLALGDLLLQPLRDGWLLGPGGRWRRAGGGPEGVGLVPLPEDCTAGYQQQSAAHSRCAAAPPGQQWRKALCYWPHTTTGCRTQPRSVACCTPFVSRPLSGQPAHSGSTAAGTLHHQPPPCSPGSCIIPGMGPPGGAPM